MVADKVCRRPALRLLVPRRSSYHRSITVLLERIVPSAHVWAFVDPILPSVRFFRPHARIMLAVLLLLLLDQLIFERFVPMRCVVWSARGSVRLVLLPCLGLECAITDGVERWVIRVHRASASAATARTFSERRKSVFSSFACFHQNSIFPLISLISVSYAPGSALARQKLARR